MKPGCLCWWHEATRTVNHDCPVHEGSDPTIASNLRKATLAELDAEVERYCRGNEA